MRDIKGLMKKPHQGVDTAPQTPQTVPVRLEVVSQGGINPLMHQPLDPSRTVAAPGARKPSGKAEKKPNPLLQPPVLVTAGLLLVAAELALWLAGPGWWLVGNAVLLAAVLLVAGWLLARRRNDKTGRGRERKGASARTGSPSGPGLRGLLPRSLRKGAAGTGPGGSGSGGGLGGGGKRPSGGGVKGLMSRLGGKSTPGGKTGGGPAGGGGGKSGNTGGDSKPGSDKKPGAKRSGWWSANYAAAKKKPGSDNKAGKLGPVKAADKPQPNVPGKPASKPGGQDKQGNPPPAPKHATPNTNYVRGNDTMTTVPSESDASLQKWGRNLRHVPGVLDEFAHATRKDAAQFEAMAASMQALANQGDSDLPAAKPLVAEAAAIAADLKAIAAERAEHDNRLRRIRERSEALSPRYLREHEVDEARLAGERGGRHVEKRADVSVAEQDT
ncbi:hypothetical protein [Melissospora conviva]|uniref:hypothetical protein n=1 Tax=Melissospora conviva TaxID=3388432 RepID=UPI003C19FD52